MTRTRRLVLIGFAFAALAPAAVATAHHGWSGFDTSKTLTVEGTVASIDYKNPHVTIALNAAPQTWEVDLAPPSRMGARGLPDGAIKAGDAVTVVGYPHKTEPQVLRAERITVAGKTVELR